MRERLTPVADLEHAVVGRADKAVAHLDIPEEIFGSFGFRVGPTKSWTSSYYDRDSRIFFFRSN